MPRVAASAPAPPRRAMPAQANRRLAILPNIGPLVQPTTKAQVIAALQSERPVRVTASLFNVQMFAPQAALVTYRALRHSDPAVYSLRSSVWEQKRGQWRMVFHQGTVVPDKL